MKSLAALSACLLLTGCAGHTVNRYADAISEPDAIRRGTHEVERRGWSLPPRYTVHAEPLEISQWGSPNIPMFAVRFYAPERRGKRVELYDIAIDRRSGAVIEATNLLLLERGG
jgi:hypothetical protein